jgi:hypothetical protein
MRPYTDEELRDLAWSFAHNNFTAWGTPRFYDSALADILTDLLKKVRDGKDDNNQANRR